MKTEPQTDTPITNAAEERYVNWWEFITSDDEFVSQEAKRNPVPDSWDLGRALERHNAKLLEEIELLTHSLDDCSGALRSLSPVYKPELVIEAQNLLSRPLPTLDLP